MLGKRDEQVSQTPQVSQDGNDNSACALQAANDVAAATLDLTAELAVHCQKRLFDVATLQQATGGFTLQVCQSGSLRLALCDMCLHARPPALAACTTHFHQVCSVQRCTAATSGAVLRQYTLQECEAAATLREGLANEAARLEQALVKFKALQDAGDAGKPLLDLLLGRPVAENHCPAAILEQAT